MVHGVVVGNCCYAWCLLVHLVHVVDLVHPLNLVDLLRSRCLT